MIHRIREAVLHSCLVLALCPNPATAATLNAESITKQIHTEKVFKTEVRVDPDVQPDSVILWTPLDQTRKEQDLKIDAVLMAKAVRDADPKDFHGVYVRYSGDGSRKAPYKEIRVSLGDITSFGEGKVSVQDFLKSIAVRDQAPEPVETPHRSRRLLPLERVELVGCLGELLLFARGYLYLEQTGENTKAYRTDFDNLISMAESKNVREVKVGLAKLAIDRRKLREPKPATADNDPLNWRFAVARLNKDLSSELGTDAPVRGAHLFHRAKIVALLKELTERNVDVTEQRKQYKLLDDQCQDLHTKVRLTDLKKMITELEIELVRHPAFLKREQP